MMSHKHKGLLLIRKALLSTLLAGAAFGGYYLYQNPEIIVGVSKNSATLPSITQQVKNKTNTESLTAVLGQTTSLIEEGLRSVKVPKNLSGTDQEIVLEDVFNQFTAKVKGLPTEQVDKVKIQFCQDLLTNVPGASVVIDTP